MIRYYFFTLFALCAIASIAQTDTTTYYFNDFWEEIPSKENAVYYRKAFKQDSGFAVRDYYIGGQLQMTGFFLDDSLLTRHGLFTTYAENGTVVSSYTCIRNAVHGKRTEWYEDGKLLMVGSYKDGKLIGKHASFHPNGQVASMLFYSDTGKITDYQYWDSAGKVVRYQEIVTGPQFPGGMDGLFAFLTAHVSYPSKMKNDNIEGRAIVEMRIDRKGKIVHAEVVSESNKAFGEEALRVVKLMPDWVVAKRWRKPKSTGFILPITFILRQED